MSSLPGAPDLNPISGSFAGTVAFDPNATGVGMLLENNMAYFNVHSVAVSTVELKDVGVHSQLWHAAAPCLHLASRRCTCVRRRDDSPSFCQSVYCIFQLGSFQLMQS